MDLLSFPSFGKGQRIHPQSFVSKRNFCLTLVLTFFPPHGPKPRQDVVKMKGPDLEETTICPKTYSNSRSLECTPNHLLSEKKKEKEKLREALFIS